MQKGKSDNARDFNDENNSHTAAKEKDSLKENREQAFEENKIVEEIRQNKIFYNSEGFKSFRKKTKKSCLNIDNYEEEISNFKK